MEIVGFILSVIAGVLLLIFLVVVHELGHAIVARRNGVVVEEFGIGFPPRAWSKKLKNGILFSLNWLPLGGFVKLQGENDAANKKGDYGAASLWAKTKILLAGVGINWLVAVILFTLLALIGLPKFSGVIDNQFTIPNDTTEIRQPVSIANVVAGSPAAKAGLQAGDQLLRFNGLPIDQPSNLNSFTQQYHGQSVEIIYKRGNAEHKAKVSLLAKNTSGKGYLGVGPTQRTMYKSTWSAPIVGVVTTYQLTEATLKSLGGMVANLTTGIVQKFSSDPNTRNQGGEKLNEIGANVAGPVGILGIIFPAAVQAGPDTLILLTAIISLTLAVMNVLPIPALDGGRLFVTLLFRALKRPLTKEREEKIHGAGFMVLMALVVIVTVADVAKFGR